SDLENDQTVTRTGRRGGRGELDGVGVAGRAFERVAKPAGAGVNPLVAGRSPVVAPMAGAGMAGRASVIIRATHRGQADCMAKKSPQRSQNKKADNRFLSSAFRYYQLKRFR